MKYRIKVAAILLFALCIFTASTCLAASMGGGFTYNANALYKGDNIKFSWSVYPSGSFSSISMTLYYVDNYDQTNKLWSQTQYYYTDGSTTITIPDGKYIYSIIAIYYSNGRFEKLVSNNIPICKRIQFINFSPSDITLTVGEQYNASPSVRIDPTDATNQTLTYSSKDTSIASVDENGIVTAHQAGYTTIYAHATDGSNKKGYLFLTIVPGVENITMPYEIELYRDEGMQIEANIWPPEASTSPLTWSSSNPAIIDVDQDGWIYAWDAGEAIITASAKNGISASTLVTSYIPMENIELSSQNVYLSLNTLPSLSLSYHISPENAYPENLYWYSSSPQVADVNEYGRITAYAEGTTEISVVSEYGCYDSCIVTVFNNMNVLILSDNLQCIGEESFAGIPQANIVSLSDQIQTIGSRAFADCSNLYYIFIPAQTATIAEDAFDNCPNLQIVCPAGSTAHEYAIAHDIGYFLD